jgi:cytochrome c-type protein NapC
MMEDIRKGDAKCIDCHTGDKIHPRAFAHGGSGKAVAAAGSAAPVHAGQK